MGTRQSGERTRRSRRLAEAPDHARRGAVDRAQVPLDLIKRWYGYGRVRYRSLVRNALQLQLLAVALNLRCALALTG